MKIHLSKFSDLQCHCLFIMLFICSNIYAAPSIVYRMDKREPADIFEEGFKSWGTNDNLLEHIEGISMGVTDGSGSAFVSTTSDRQYALDFAQAVRLQNFYIYDIRPTDNFYSLNITFSHFAQTDPGYNQILYNFESSNEYAAFNGISNSQIIRATRYVVENNVATPSQVFVNNAYVNAITTANTQPYPHMYSSEVETIFSGIYECANHTYSKKRLKNDNIGFPFYEKMLYCYEEAKENATPELISILPENIYLGNKNVKVVFAPSEFENKYPFVSHYRILYRPLKDGTSPAEYKTINIPVKKKALLYKELVTLDYNVIDFTLGEIIILAVNFSGDIILPDGSNVDDFKYLMSSLYSMSPDGWFKAARGSESKAICYDNQVMLGGSHWGDENATTYFRCVYLFVNGQVAKPDLGNIIKLKTVESSGAMITCPNDSLIVGIEHDGDENGQTTYSCANFYLGFNKQRKVKVTSTKYSNPLIQSNHQFSCGSNGKDQGEGSDHGMPPPANQALIGRTHVGDENGHTLYECANLSE